ERLGARAVEGMGVVYEHESGPGLGMCRKQAERRRADREPLAHRARAERERAFERRGLRRRDPLEQAERGAQELEQTGERDVRLRVDPPSPEHPKPRRLLFRVFEERRLADPGLADEREDGTTAGARGRQDAVELLPLALTA